ncbi:DUF1176 domain-containing protein [Pseudoduganella albidiflava]|uniref:DUF1176 domain-containing protein n=1 Tax=Pseudoduganella albidiflava TaxID=321983 RepID=A0A411X3S9_9BURK|nr:DUF1176 domain-containing protein [Pseudoduganella albidiflava]QBI03677.1 DUF1176 domain-containing protein [Pseudoduganella albidiflava]GGY69790.1 hypothetical protein GCM10007387_59710 [Pseudoduganella albidiflava]
MKKLIAPLLATLAIPVLAATPAGTEFSHHDWELACDNTRTCRAAGYQPDGVEPAVSVLLERVAGPGRALAATLQLGSYGDEAPEPKSATVTMKIDGKAVGPVKIEAQHGTLTPAQAQALVSAVSGTGRVEWTDGTHTWALSGKGASAVLLKMDEVQGRLGTMGALLRKGSRPEDTVPGPLPAPEVSPASAGSTEVNLPPAARTALLRELRKALDAGTSGCEAFEPDQLTVMKLTPEKLLVQMPCWTGAYNTGSAYLVANKAAPFNLELVTADATDYAAGIITSAQKGRGMGDCWATREWVWDGRRFVLTESTTSGMCRLVAPGGAWRLPTYVAKVTRGPR